MSGVDGLVERYKAKGRTKTNEKRVMVEGRTESMRLVPSTIRTNQSSSSLVLGSIVSASLHIGRRMLCLDVSDIQDTRKRTEMGPWCRVIMCRQRHGETPGMVWRWGVRRQDDLPTLVLSLADDSTNPAPNFLAKA
jgi:hypothetical protein